jgi:DNA-binding ferritin-like protein
VAHWNLKGPYFAALHPLFDSIASSALSSNDEIAERAVALGALATGTVRTSASRSRLPQYPEDLTRDLEHVAQVVGPHRRLPRRVARSALSRRGTPATQTPSIS